jgi:hypothetical protein
MDALTIDGAEQREAGDPWVTAGFDIQVEVCG